MDGVEVVEVVEVVEGVEGVEGVGDGWVEGVGWNK